MTRRGQFSQTLARCAQSEDWGSSPMRRRRDAALLAAARDRLANEPQQVSRLILDYRSLGPRGITAGMDGGYDPPVPASPPTLLRPLALRLPPAQEAQIILTWLGRLRWAAVAGQVAACFIAEAILGLDLPLIPVAVVIALTLLSNVLLVVRLRRPPSPRWAVPAVLLLDIGFLTALLMLTGGPDNPFSSLYLVHVAMAVAVLGVAWTWLVVVAALVSYILLIWRSMPLAWERGGPPAWAEPAGKWSALVLVSAVIAYFIGRIRHSLRLREHELSRLVEQGRRNDQLAALTTLAAGAAHELGTPLATIAVVAKELERDAAKVPEDFAIAEDAKLIREQVDRCRRILDRMRGDLSEALAQKGGPLHVNELIERLRSDLAEAERIRLSVHCQDGIDLLPAPAGAIHQALGILVRNAFDATKDGGVVTLNIARRGGSLRFEVEDRGTGMAEEIRRRAGEPFFTTKAPGAGMGLGLFLVRLVAEKAGGTFALTSEPGVGTTCVLELPENA